jgi:hypothetical protein
LGKVGGFEESDFARFLEVFLVADEDDDDVGTGEGARVVEPVG